jgi:predicted alpha/beta superfamily hydrolase
MSSRTNEASAASEAGETTIRVRYPQGRGALALRTALDWERDVEPLFTEGDEAVFRIAHDMPCLEFKPLLRIGRGDALWARGANRMAWRGNEHATYPAFGVAEDGGPCDSPRILPVPFAETGVRARILLPEGYGENPLRRHAVVYMHDGRNLFHDEESFTGHSWRVAQALASLEAMGLVQAPLVVGIEPEERDRDYTSPGYLDHGRRIVEGLVPWIARHHRVLEGHRHSVVLGSSLGGVASLLLGWQWPEVFGAVGCLSSTFGWCDDLFDRVISEPRRDLRIYLDSGWPRDNYETTVAMRDALLRRGYRPGVDLLHFAFPNAAHDERSWASRLHLPLQFLLGEAATPARAG